MFLRNDEHVRRRLGMDVFEGENVLILVDFFRGNLTPDDPTEETTGHKVGHRLPRYGVTITLSVETCQLERGHVDFRIGTM